MGTPNLYSETFGLGDDIILVHGWGMHAGFWREFARELARDYCVTCPDLPGHGRSEMIDDFSLSAISSKLLEAAPERAHWIGWSLGASIVLHLATQFPERVKTVGLIAGNPKFSKTEGWDTALALEVLDSFHASLRQDYAATLLRFLKLQTRGMCSPKSAFRTLRKRLNECHPPHPKALCGGVDILKTADLRRCLQQLGHPVLILLGAEDSLVPVDVGERMQSLCPSSKQWIIKEAGHIPFFSHRNETLACVSEFLNQQG